MLVQWIDCLLTKITVTQESITCPEYKNFNTSWNTSGRNFGFLIVYGKLEEYALDHSSRFRLWKREHLATRINLCTEIDTSSFPTTKTTSPVSRSLSNFCKSFNKASTPTQVFPSLPTPLHLPTKFFAMFTFAKQTKAETDRRSFHLRSTGTNWRYSRSINQSTNQSINCCLLGHYNQDPTGAIATRKEVLAVAPSLTSPALAWWRHLTTNTRMLWGKPFLRWWRHKNDFSESMGFIRSFGRTYLKKVRTQKFGSLVLLEFKLIILNFLTRD